MPYSSAQISGLVGGQMAMFSNQQQYSQQISGLYGTGPQQMAGGMQNPFPSSPSYGQTGTAAMDGGTAGTQFAQGMAGSVEGMMGGAALAGGFIGGKAGWADPITGMGRAFMAGGGNAFGGIGGAMSQGYRTGGVAVQGATSMGNMGRGLAGAARGGMGALGQIGARGAMGALAGGLGAAAATGGLYYAASLPITEAAGQFASGAQNVSDVGMMAQQHMGPQYGAPGARPGGKMGRSQIREMVGVLEEIAGDDSMVTMDALKRLMDQAGQSGMLQGIGSAQEFKQKFGGMVKQIKEIAQVMGTSLEEAAPLMGQMRQMGVWSAADVMGTAGAVRSVGQAAAPHLMATMQSGAQLSHAMGGRLGAGATMGREAFLGVQAATRVGTLSPEMIREFTGGTGGVEGQRMVAQQMQGVMGRFSESPMGRLMMAGMGKFEGGKFTGGIDKDMMERFMSGEVGVGELQNIGQKRTSSSREAATSYMVRKGAIGQEMMAEGGMEGMSAAVTKVMERAGYGEADENIQNMFIQKMTGVDARTAEMIRRIGDDLPRIQEDKQRRLEATLDDQFREVDIRMNQSWQGFKDSLGQAFEESWKPVRELGADVATGIGRRMDRAMGSLTGRTKRFGMSSQQVQQAMWSKGGLGEGGGMPSLTTKGQFGMGDTSFAERTRNLSRMGKGMFGAGALLFGGGTNTEMLSRMGATTTDIGPGGVMPEGYTAVETGGVGAGALIGSIAGGILSAGNPLGMLAGGLVGGALQKNVFGERIAVNASERAEIISGAVTRAEDRSWAGLGMAGEKAASQGNIDKAKGAMRSMLAGDPKLMADYAEYKKSNPEVHKQTQWLLGKLEKKDPSAARALRDLAGKSDKAGADSRMMDAMALVMEEAGIKGNWAPDYDKDAARATDMQMFSSTAEYDEAISQTIKEAAELADESLLGVAGGAALGAMVGGLLGPLGMAAGGLIGGILGQGADEETRSFFEEKMQGPHGELLAKAMAGDKEAADQLLTVDPDALAQVGEMFGDDREKMKAVGEKLKVVSVQRYGRARLTMMGKTAATARRDLKAGVELQGEQGAKLRELLKVYSGEDYATGDRSADKKARQLAQELIEDGDFESLGRKGGVVGRGLAAFGMRRAEIGGMKTGELSASEREEMLKLAPEGMRAELEEMLGGEGGFTGSEKERFQQMFTKRAARSGAAGSMAGRKSATDRMTELLTSYTEANTKFVFAVATSISGIETKDLKAVSEDVKREMSNPATRGD